MTEDKTQSKTEGEETRTWQRKKKNKSSEQKGSGEKWKQPCRKKAKGGGKEEEKVTDRKRAGSHTCCRALISHALCPSYDPCVYVLCPYSSLCVCENLRIKQRYDYITPSKSKLYPNTNHSANTHHPVLPGTIPKSTGNGPLAEFIKTFKYSLIQQRGNLRGQQIIIFSILISALLRNIPFIHLWAWHT